MNEPTRTPTCDEALDLLEPFVDGDLPEDEAERLRAHLAACPACAAELALAERIRRELRALPKFEPRGAEVVPFRPRRSGLPLRTAAAAAVLALAVGGGALFLRSQEEKPPQPSPEQIAEATREARFALAYIGRVGRRTGLDVRDGVLSRRLVEPATRGVRALESTRSPK